jgi:hypothetical protein
VGLGQRLIGAACDAFDAWGVRHAGLFTFAESAKHVWTYGKYGFYPRYLTAIMAAPAQAGSGEGWSRCAELAESQRQQVQAVLRELTEQLDEGLDLSGEIRPTLARKLGDTVLLWDGVSHLAGFAICHWGPVSEAGAGCLLSNSGRCALGLEGSIDLPCYSRPAAISQSPLACRSCWLGST